MNFYDILEVSKEATKDEIKSAFRQKARQYHPDVNKAPDAEEKFKELGKAYETLMDDEKRAVYDRYGEDGLQNAGFSYDGPFAGGFGDLSDIINSVFESFGFSSGSRDPNAPQHGEDLRLDVEIEFEEAVFGVTKEIKFDRLEACQSCKGTGAREGSGFSTCKNCGGRGKVQQVTQNILGHFSQVITCPQCKGKGRTIDTPCNECKSDGRISVERKLDLKIPAGVDNLSKMRLTGEGDAGKNNGPAGDLYVVLRVKPSEYYYREGLNVITNLEISPAQAVLGDEVAVKTLDGEKKIQIPAGTQSGNTIKIKGSGIPHLQKPSHRGDHVVLATVKTPVNLSDEEKNLYKQLYELNTGKKYQENFVDKLKEVFK